MSDNVEIARALRTAGHEDLAVAMQAARDELLWAGRYLKVYRRDGWYEFLHDSNGLFVAVLGHQGNKMLGRYERCPPHDDGIALCALTGGIGPGEDPASAALRELYEESGIRGDAQLLRSLGEIRPSKASDSRGYLYACDLTGVTRQDKHTGPGDGTEGEKGSWCGWIDIDEALRAKDPQLITMVARLQRARR